MRLRVREALALDPVSKHDLTSWLDDAGGLVDDQLLVRHVAPSVLAVDEIGKGILGCKHQKKQGMGYGRQNMAKIMFCWMMAKILQIVLTRFKFGRLSCVPYSTQTRWDLTCSKCALQNLQSLLPCANWDLGMPRFEVGTWNISLDKT